MCSIAAAAVMCRTFPSHCFRRMWRLLLTDLRCLRRTVWDFGWRLRGPCHYQICATTCQNCAAWRDCRPFVCGKLVAKLWATACLGCKRSRVQIPAARPNTLSHLAPFWTRASGPDPCRFLVGIGFTRAYPHDIPTQRDQNRGSALPASMRAMLTGWTDWAAVIECGFLFFSHCFRSVAAGPRM